jgi:putative sigma-54 modulation protein
MELELTARQVTISKALRTQAAEGMNRIARILGKSASASIVFSTQKRMQFVEVTIQARLHTIVSKGKAGTMQSALHKAIENAENQALRHRDRRMAIKRKPKQEKTHTELPVTRPKTRRLKPVADAADEKPVRTGAKTRATITAHSFPAPVEPRIVTSGDALVLKPMSIEEAVKEAEYRDRDLLVFHNLSGELFVLHRSRDGQFELVEIP